MGMDTDIAWPIPQAGHGKLDVACASARYAAWVSGWADTNDCRAHLLISLLLPTGYSECSVIHDY